MSPAAFVSEKADRPIVRRRRFSDGEKRHFLDLAKQPGSSISDVAQRYDLAVALLFRWRKELGEGAAPFAGFTPVSVVDEEAPATLLKDDATGLMSSAPPQERLAGGMEIALENGRRVRVDAGADPEAVRRLVTLLEGAAP